MKLEEGDLVLCTVKKVERTNVFVDIEEYYLWFFTLRTLNL